MALPVGSVDRGDEFARFYAVYAPRVAGVARRWVEDASVDDVVQETLLRAYDAGVDLDQRDAWPWLATVARRVCHDLHRRRRRLSLVSDPASAVVPGPPDARPAGDLVEDSARTGYVVAALDGLPDRQRTLLWRRHVEGRRCADIAADEGTSVEAVKSALARARHAFQARYEGWRGLVPGVLHGAAARMRSASALLARGLPAAPLTPALRTGAVGVLAALLAFGLAPPGEATTPGRTEPGRSPSPCACLDSDVSGSVAAGGPWTSSDTPVSDVPDPGGASASPVDSVGGRLIRVQPPKFPDAPPTPESPLLVPGTEPLPAIEMPALLSDPVVPTPVLSPQDAVAAVVGLAEEPLDATATTSSSPASSGESQLTVLV